MTILYMYQLNEYINPGKNLIAVKSRVYFKSYFVLVQSIKLLSLDIPEQWRIMLASLFFLGV